MGWTWNKTNKTEYWENRNFETREEAMDSAIGSGYTKFYLGETETIPLPTYVDTDRILEDLDAAYADDSGCEDYIYDGVSDEDKKWLENRLSDLMCEFNEKAKIDPGWFRIISEEFVSTN